MTAYPDRSEPETPGPWRALPRRNLQKVSHLLAADLRRRILSGELAADQQLPSEAELTAALQVSRETLREALRILESESLLEIRRGRGGGAVVRRPGLDAVGRYVALLLQLRRTTLAHLQEARSVVEPPAAELVAGRATAEDVERLVGLHDAERSTGDDLLEFVTAVGAFDQAVIEMSGNQTLSVIAGVFRDIYAGQVYSAIDNTDPGTAERIGRRVVVSHSAFLDAVRRGDASLARGAWIDYLDTTSGMLVGRDRSRWPFDITPLWRARAGHVSDAPAQRRAMAVAGEIRARIAEGRLQEGDRLPPLAELADEFDVSRPTLREALRILEMELLLDLRTGDRGGAQVRAARSLVAAQLAGIVLEARQTTMRDYNQAVRAIESAIVVFVAERINQAQLAQLVKAEAELAASVDDTPRFMAAWWQARTILFSATKNPALTVVAEILNWVRIGVEPALAAGAAQLPFVGSSNRHAHSLFAQFVGALTRHDATGARDIWAKCLRVGAVFLEESELGTRLVLDLMDERRTHLT